MHADQEATLTTQDGVTLSAVHVQGPVADHSTLCFIVAHGFTGGWRKPGPQRVVDRLSAFGSVIAIDMRGHGSSGGASTVGDREVLDVSAAVRWARELGFPFVVTVGFSMGGSVVLRQAAVEGEPVEAVVSVSAPAFWFYRGTRVMRGVHHAVGTRVGRTLMRARGVRITGHPAPNPMPIQPVDAVALIAVPLLIVHGTVDRYFPLEHPRALHRAAVAGGNSTAQLWEVAGFGHAENGIDNTTLDAMGRWARTQCGLEQIGSRVGWSRS
jgi:pimeloyl-ACP methyl ester carboxylesterase